MSTKRPAAHRLHRGMLSNALRLEDLALSAHRWETLVRWLVDAARGKQDHLIYQEGPYHATRGRWCKADSRGAPDPDPVVQTAPSSPAIDGAAYSRNAQLGDALGTAGLFSPCPASYPPRNGTRADNANNNNNKQPTTTTNNNK